MCLRWCPVGGERRVALGDLVGAAEIADRRGLSHPPGGAYLAPTAPGFPEPIARLTSALIWSWANVDAWARKPDRLPARADYS
jgi:hypothetical protein